MRRLLLNYLPIHTMTLHDIIIILISLQCIRNNGIYLSEERKIIEKHSRDANEIKCMGRILSEKSDSYVMIYLFILLYFYFLLNHIYVKKLFMEYKCTQSSDIIFFILCPFILLLTRSTYQSLAQLKLKKNR